MQYNMNFISLIFGVVWHIIFLTKSIEHVTQTLSTIYKIDISSYQELHTKLLTHASLVEVDSKKSCTLNLKTTQFPNVIDRNIKVSTISLSKMWCIFNTNSKNPVQKSKNLTLKSEKQLENDALQTILRTSGNLIY